MILVAVAQWHKEDISSSLLQTVGKGKLASYHVLAVNWQFGTGQLELVEK